MAPAMPGEEMVEEPRRMHGSVWGNPAVASLTAAATSITLHAIVILIAFLGYINREAIKKLIDTRNEQTIIPSAELTANPGGIPHPGMNNDPTRDAAQNIDPSVQQSDQFAESKSEDLNKTLMQGSSQTGGNTAAGPKAGLGTNKGLSGGGLAKFGVPGGGGGIGPKGAVFGDGGGNVTRIAFIIDGTGTMVGARYDLVKAQLVDTISKLKPIQQFNVLIFHNAEEFGSLDKNALVDGTPTNKKKALDFLDKFDCAGQTNPIPTIEAAFKMKPQLIYFLSDGEFDNLVPYDEVVKTITKLNSDKSVKINTILVGDRDKRAEEVLRKIANDNGGTSRYCNMDELRKHN